MYLHCDRTCFIKKKPKEGSKPQDKSEGLM